jgi:hypothetical protein
MDPSYEDREAPPDATRPLLEDNLHYGCQWHSPGELDTMYNEVGYEAALLRGMHLVNQPVGVDDRQGFRKRGLGPKASRNVPPEASHCGLVCHA